MIHNPTLFVLTAEQKNKGIRENLLASIELEQMIRYSGLSYRKIFSASASDTFVVQSYDYNRDQFTVIELARLFNQKCVIEVSQGCQGWVRYLDGTQKYLGQVDFAIDILNFSVKEELAS